MKKIVLLTLTVCLALGAGSVFASPKDDIKAFQHYFKKRFPKVKFDKFADGSFALDKGLAVDMESQRDFPPWLDFLEDGEKIWKTKFPNGKSFASCFGKKVSKIRVKYPFWDEKGKTVRTLEGDIIACQKKNGVEPFKVGKGKIAHLSAYIVSKSHGDRIHVVVPNTKAALAAYNRGKHHFYAKRGQLDFSCADCHMYNSGQWIRGNMLSPALGHVTHFPVWRGSSSRKNLKNGDGFLTLEGRYVGCNKQVRAKPFKPQSEEYRDLEFFHAAMSNGLPIMGPDYRE